MKLPKKTEEPLELLGFGDVLLENDKTIRRFLVTNKKEKEQEK